MKGTGIELKTTQPFTRDAGDTSGLPAPVVGKIFEALQGEISTTELADGFVVARLAQVKPADPAEHPDQIQTVRRATSQALAGDLSDSFLSALEAKVGVKIDRSQVTREE